MANRPLLPNPLRTAESGRTRAQLRLGPTGRTISPRATPSSDVPRWPVFAAMVRAMIKASERGFGLGFGVAFDPGEDFRLGFLGADPTEQTHPFAGFEVFVVLEKMRDLRQR